MSRRTSVSSQHLPLAFFASSHYHRSSSVPCSRRSTSSVASATVHPSNSSMLLGDDMKYSRRNSWNGSKSSNSFNRDVRSPSPYKRRKNNQSKKRSRSPATGATSPRSRSRPGSPSELSRSFSPLASTLSSRRSRRRRSSGSLEAVQRMRLWFHEAIAGVPGEKLLTNIEKYFGDARFRTVEDIMELHAVEIDETFGVVGMEHKIKRDKGTRYNRLLEIPLEALQESTGRTSTILFNHYDQTGNQRLEPFELYVLAIDMIERVYKMIGDSILDNRPKTTPKKLIKLVKEEAIHFLPPKLPEFKENDVIRDMVIFMVDALPFDAEGVVSLLSFMQMISKVTDLCFEPWVDGLAAQGPFCECECAIL